MFALAQQRPKGGGRGIGDKDIEIAERLLHLSEHRPDRLAVTHIGLEQQRLGAPLCDLSGNRFRFGRIPAVIHADPCPLGRQPQGNRSANTPRRAGDKGYFVCETHVRIPFDPNLPWSAHR